MSKKESFILNRLRSVGYAFRGLKILITTEKSIQIQLIIAVVVTGFGIYFNITSLEWIIQLAMIGLVMAIEGVNTAIEQLADFVHPEKHHKIGYLKDIAAGAVLIASITAIIVGIIIYSPYFL